MTIQAVIYARVSTDDQAEKGYSLPTQLEAGRKLAAANGYAIPAEVTDDSSGATLDRPGLDRLRAMIKRERVDAVIVYDPDRLSRDDVDFLVICREWERAGVALHFVNGGDFPNTSEGDLLRYLAGWKGKRERASIIERSTRGRNAKAKAGKWVGIGFAPYGYQREGERDKARLVVCEPEARIVRLVFEWYTRGNGKRGAMSLRAIAAELDRLGEVPPNHRRNPAQFWIPATLRNILSNETYAGRTHYGKSRMVAEAGEKTKRVKQPRESWIAMNAPELVIVDRETWEAAQKRFERNKELSRRNQKHEYLMTGFFRCAACNSAMAGGAGMHNGYEAVYYRCGNHWRRRDLTVCPNSGKSIVTHHTDSLVWAWLSGLIVDDEKLDQMIREWSKRNASDLEAKRERLTALAELREKAQRKADRLAASYAEALGESDETTAEALKSQLKIASKSRDALAAEYANIEAELRQVELTPEREALIKKAARAVRARIENPTFEQKRELFDLFNLRAKFRVDDTGRWVDVACELTAGEVSALPLW